MLKLCFWQVVDGNYTLEKKYKAFENCFVVLMRDFEFKRIFTSPSIKSQQLSSQISLIIGHLFIGTSNTGLKEPNNIPWEQKRKLENIG